MVYWGPPLWKSIHAITRSYPDKPTLEQKKQYQDFIKSLGHVLPCPNCRGHYNNYVSELDWNFVLKDHESLVKFGIDFHNDVNKRTGKQIIPSTEALKLVYSGHDETQSILDSSFSHTIKNIIIGILIIVLMIIGFVLRRN